MQETRLGPRKTQNHLYSCDHLDGKPDQYQCNFEYQKREREREWVREKSATWSHDKEYLLGNGGFTLPQTNG